ncbi:DUF937 domain-containing protein [Deinococcus marmoris]|uniref:DUF937 domain-containing protein n=1 Tax=Deinococcus marmoris TaxID=249408 RepID=UPI0005573CB5|nr:DUF937 domain-containing protein [Deinococcus marmoris]
MSKNATDLIQSFFDPGAVVRLAQAVGLEPEVAGRVLEAGLPLQLAALAESAKTPDGEAMIAEAVGALPPFGSVAEALEESGGADNLRQAGEMLAPVLLGEVADGLPAQVSTQTQADPARVQTLLQIALPLLLSALGQHGMKAGNIAPMLAGLGGLGLAGAAGADAVVPEAAETVIPAAVEAPETAPVAPVAEVPAEEVPAEAPAVEPPPVVPVPVESAPVALEKPASEAMPPESVPAEAPAAPADTSPPDPSTPEGLLKYLQARFGGPVGQKIGAVAGFGGGVRKQAALAALPVVLAALVGKASGQGNGAGGDLDKLARPFAPLTGEDGQVNTDLLDSPVEVSRIEGQGRGLLASLFGDVNAVTGRLGSALGGSGDSSRRLLALLTPLVLSALTRAHAGGLGALPIAGLADGLKAALPSGFSSLGVLVGSLVSGTPLPGAVSSTVQTTPRAVVQQGSPATPPRPSPLKPPRPARFEKPAPPVAPPPRRRGFPLWLIPLLLLLLLGGCWVLQNRQPAVPAVPTPTSPTTLGDSGTLPGLPVQTVFTEPQPGAAVPASGFTLRGTGTAGENVDVFLGDGKVGSAPVAPDGTWSLDVGADAPQGPQTYTLKNAAGGEMATLPVVVGGADATGAGSTETPPVTAAPTDTQGGALPETPGTAPDTTVPDATTPDATTPDATTPQMPSADGTTPATPGATAPGTVPVVISEPSEGAQVPSGGLTLRGTGPAGEQFVLFHSGLRAGSVTVGLDGNWKADILAGAALPGPQSYDLRNAAGQVVARVRLQVAPSGQGAAGGASGSALDSAGATPAGAGGVTVSSPASGAQVDGAGFALSGTGPAGQTFEVLEDGVSIGSFTVGADGNWTRQVSGPSAGAKTYTVRSADGQQVAAVPVTVGAAPANAQGAACTQPLSVSLKDGETVTAPYRFGGVGGGDAYTITVKRGERTVGSKTVPVGAGCVWNFTSNPGSSAGQASTVTYEVRPATASPSDAPAAKLTLNVR